jgi:hypothetical protein
LNKNKIKRSSPAEGILEMVTGGNLRDIVCLKPVQISAILQHLGFEDTHYETEFNTVNDRKSNTAGLLAKSLNC